MILNYVICGFHKILSADFIKLLFHNCLIESGVRIVPIGCLGP